MIYVVELSFPTQSRSPPELIKKKAPCIRTGLFSWWCARHVRRLDGERPLQALQWELLAEGKGVHREVESEGSRRQTLGPTNRNRI